MATRGNPKWKDGESGNPNGRPKKPEIELVREAMAETELEKKKSLWKHLVEEAYEDNAVLIALTKKFLPDQVNLVMEEDLADVLAKGRKRKNAAGY